MSLRVSSPRVRRRGTVAIAFVSMFVVLLGQMYGYWRVNQSTGLAGPTVVLMGELDLPPLLQPERIRAATGDRHADLLLWPELAYHHAVVEIDRDATAEKISHHTMTQVSIARNPGDNKAIRYLQQSAREQNSTLVIGCERIHFTEEGTRSYNSLACVDQKGEFQGCYDKINLVPGAESTMRSAELFDAQEFAYSRGDDLGAFRLPTSKAIYRFAPAICYDLCFGKHFRAMSSQDVDFLVQCGAEGQDEAGEISWLMLRYARLRAIENRRALVRNVTFGHSALIDGNGRVLDFLTTEPIVSPTWLGTVPIDNRRSLYAVCGDWVAYIACFATLFLVVPLPGREETEEGLS